MSGWHEELLLPVCCKNDISVISAVFLTPEASPPPWVGVMLVGLRVSACRTSASVVPTCQNIVLSKAEANVGALHVLPCRRAEGNRFGVEADIFPESLL